MVFKVGEQEDAFAMSPILLGLAVTSQEHVAGGGVDVKWTAVGGLSVAKAY